MIFIYPEYQTVTSATISSEDGSFPIANLFDDNPSKLWKASAGVQGAFLRAPVTTGCVCGVFNTNSTTAEAAMSIDSEELDISGASSANGGDVMIPCTSHGLSSGDCVVIKGTTNYDGIWTLTANTDADNLAITIGHTAETFDQGTEKAYPGYSDTTYTLTYNRFWFAYTDPGGAHHVNIEFYNSSTTVYAGCVKIGSSVTLSDPRYPLKEKSIDYSTYEELNNGALFVNLRDILRGFDISVVDSLTDYYTFRTMFQATGKNPIACLLIEGVDNYNYSIFGRFTSGVSVDHISSSLSQISFSFEEVV